MNTAIVLTPFCKPVHRAIICAVWDMWLDGCNKDFIANQLHLSCGKVSAIINDPAHEIPNEWKKHRSNTSD
jgi:hypothetical protein